MSEAPQHFDVAVVGGGPAGLAAAVATADAGARVASHLWPAHSRRNEMSITYLR